MSASIGSDDNTERHNVKNAESQSSAQQVDDECSVSVDEHQHPPWLQPVPKKEVPVCETLPRNLLEVDLKGRPLHSTPYSPSLRVQSPPTRFMDLMEETALGMEVQQLRLSTAARCPTRAKQWAAVAHVDLAGGGTAGIQTSYPTVTSAVQQTRRSASRTSMDPVIAEIPQQQLSTVSPETTPQWESTLGPRSILAKKNTLLPETTSATENTLTAKSTPSTKDPLPTSHTSANPPSQPHSSSSVRSIQTQCLKTGQDSPNTACPHSTSPRKVLVASGDSGGGPSGAWTDRRKYRPQGEGSSGLLPQRREVSRSLRAEYQIPGRLSRMSTKSPSDLAQAPTPINDPAAQQVRLEASEDDSRGEVDLLPHLPLCDRRLRDSPTHPHIPASLDARPSPAITHTTEPTALSRTRRWSINTGTANAAAPALPPASGFKKIEQNLLPTSISPTPVALDWLLRPDRHTRSRVPSLDDLARESASPAAQKLFSPGPMIRNDAQCISGPIIPLLHERMLPLITAMSTTSTNTIITTPTTLARAEAPALMSGVVGIPAETTVGAPTAEAEKAAEHQMDLGPAALPAHGRTTYRKFGRGGGGIRLDTASTICSSRDRGGGRGVRIPSCKLGDGELVDYAVLPPRCGRSFEAALVDSPVSPTRCESVFGSEDGEGGYETPMTSPETSPDKLGPIACLFPRFGGVLPQLDGSRGSLTEEVPGDEGHESGATSARGRVEDAVQETLRLLEDNEAALSDVDSSTPSARPDAAVFEQPDFEEDETPLVTASPAKGAKAFPFPRQSLSGLTSWSPCKQRQPSALLRHCESNASPRHRRLMTGGLRTPDRFISSRPTTPSKEILAVARPAEKPNPYLKRSRMQAVDTTDPFAPAPRRSIRMAEQFATLRGPPTVPRPVGRASTLVDATRRVVSDGAIWHVGGTLVTEGVASVTNGRGGRVTSGTNAPHYTADFLRKTGVTEDEAKHGRRLALAMGIDTSAKVLAFGSSSSSAVSSPGSGSPRSPAHAGGGRVWRDSVWQHSTPAPPTKSAPTKKAKEIPTIPFRVLNAPALRDDYYCSLLAYSATVQCLAVGLGPHVYLWSESRGKEHTNNIPDSLTAPFASHVTSISFSSTEGGSAILAIGRADGRITLWSPLDREPRFDSEQPAPVSCVCFRPNTVRRPSVRERCVMVATEELLVGDEAGNVYLYSVEWPDHDQRDLFDWHGSMTLLARIGCHSQQVCGIAWSPDGEHFASGGNDNQLFLFETKRVLKRPSATLATGRRARGDSTATVNVRSGDGNNNNAGIPGQPEVLLISPGQHKTLFALNAAVKAIAFAPWQPSLLAAGGGSNDRCIHFFHTLSGASLATIDCHAQVTSLIWSEKRKEIAATFGFAQPEHPFRVAVFTWPGCRMVVGIPWFGEERALYSVAYPRGPAGGLHASERNGGKDGGIDKEGSKGYGRRTREEGCLVVATSDASIKFHEIWGERGGDGGKGLGVCGVLGGSQILEGECSGEVERMGTIR